MAGQDQGRREAVNDPLAITGREQRPDRSLALQGVRAPNIGDPLAASKAQNQALTSALGGLESVIQETIAKKAEEGLTAGKAAYLSGVTEQEIIATGNRYQAQGYRTLAARDKVNNWFTTESIDLAENGMKLSPEQYQAGLMEKRKAVLDGITDPAAKKVATAAFEEFSPRLASTQMQANNKFNEDQTAKQFSANLGSVAKTSANASVKDGPLSLTPQPIAPVIQSDASERDVGIRTMLGEAQNQGSMGMAAVAHVMRNRATSKDGAFPKSIKGVALQDKQFSVWNSGEGGWAGHAENPLYQKAGEIYDAVMSGRHVDPTGGATHYYSPEGMKAYGKDKPDWYDAEAAKAGGSITIGGHVFAGKAAQGFSGQGKLNFVNAGQDKLDPGFRGILTDVSAAVGRDLTINSGHRGADHPAEANKPGGPGEHSKGTASDIDMTGMNDQQRLQLVRELRGRGVMRFGTYSNTPNMLHVDMKDQAGDGSNWFMHDRTAAKMDSAPAWVKQAAAEPKGSTTTPPPQSGTEIQNFIRGYSGIKDPQVKAKLVVDEMRRQLDAGSDSLFNDGGGVGLLRDLKAQPADIDELLKAKARFDAKKSNEFSIDRTKFKDDILARAEKGESRDTILADIEKARKRNLFDDTHANSLASEALNKVRAANPSGDDAALNANTAYLNEIGPLYQKVQAGGWDGGKVGEEVKAIAKRYGASEKEVASVVAKTFQLDQAYQTGVRSEAEAAIAKNAKREIVVKNVNTALANGQGLNLVHGERIEITNKFGNKETVSPQEYGVLQIKERNAKDITGAVSSGKMDPAKAKGELLRRTYLELQNHDVVDKELQSQIKAGLTGNIIGKDGTITQGAMQAYEAYSALKNTPNINPGYLSKTLDDSYVRSLVETADLLDSGDLSPEQSLRKAHEILNDPNRDPNDRINKDTVWTSKLKNDVSSALKDKVTPGFFERVLLDDSSNDRNAILKNGQAAAENYVTKRAEMYHMQHPNEDAAVSMKKGIDDLQANATAVVGNLVITKPGFELHKAMGISGFGKQAPDEAVKMFLDEHGADLWKGQWGNPLFSKVFGIQASDKKGESVAGAIGRSITDTSAERLLNPFPLIPSMGTRRPDMLVTYNAESGIISFDMYKNAETKEALGNPKSFNAKDIGAYYMKKQSDPGSIAKTFDKLFEAPRAMGRAMEPKPRTPGELAGETIGSMMK